MNQVTKSALLAALPPNVRAAVMRQNLKLVEGKEPQAVKTVEVITKKRLSA